MSSIAKTSTVSISSIIQTSISLRLGISRPLAIVATGSIAKTTIAKSGVAIGSWGSIAISKTSSQVQNIPDHHIHILHTEDQHQLQPLAQPQPHAWQHGQHRQS